MQVTVYQTVYVECVCDVHMDDIVAEFERRKDESTEHYWRRLIPALDAMTRIMAGVPDDVIAAIPLEANMILRLRFSAEVERYSRR